MATLLPVKNSPTLRQTANSTDLTVIKNINNSFYSRIAGFIPLSWRIASQCTHLDVKIPTPGEGLPRVIHYCADQSGCGFWRLIWPGDELMAHNKAVVMTLYQMVLNASFYRGIDAIRLQRQCTEPQLEFIKMLRKISDEMKKQTGKGFRLIYEVDDIVDYESIPEYNVCRDAFKDSTTINKIMREAVSNCDEMVVVSEYMKRHYMELLGTDKISVIPNYAPKTWLDRGYDEGRIIEKYHKNNGKPRILYAGSGTHFDVTNRANQQDDFSQINQFIINDLMGAKRYQWVFLGGLPLSLRQFVGHGVEFHPWSVITEYPALLQSLNADVMIAPLLDNQFNNAKANIKLIESGAQGIPMVAQNLACYNTDGWKWLFDTGEQMMYHIQDILSSETKYLEAVRFSRQYTESRWLKDHLDEWVLLYTSEWGSDKRKENPDFYKNNKDQFS